MASELPPNNLFICFVATIIRNRTYTLLNGEEQRIEKKQIYITVQAALNELEKIELLKGADNAYNLDYSVTASQKAILNPFGMPAKNINRQDMDIGLDLARVGIEAVEACT